MRIKVGLIADDCGQQLAPELAQHLSEACRSLKCLFNDEELRARVDKMYSESASQLSVATGFDWNCPSVAMSKKGK